ncbi:phosphoserine phosphatase [Arenicella chitinivorans]|uniref:phosphoserine phosphatase n=1 Tax=Arenicella chitinivorans TaxID=1329800 RepID=A0A918S1G0_9GAMM|nr:bifunctional phosphoserine phosphatase/homoserine phosphotransferase ThrH [Arenicella chitinivorans]GHA19180.1 phosphoserine phosphatase [Arenicella chitinivorans]
MNIVCLDLEGVLIPEIWINFAEKVGIEELKATTRDIPDYDELMRFRLKLCAEHEFRIQDIQEVIATLTPLDGAKQFCDELRADHQLIILSDTFQQFATPMMQQLDWPTIFCHELILDAQGRIADYKLRKPDHKRETVRRLHELNFNVVAAGDSYNDTTMLSEAEQGILFCPPQNVIDEFPQFPVATDYAQLRQHIDAAVAAMPVKD